MTQPPVQNRVYKLSSSVALENFDDGALLLRLTDRHLFELNPSAQRILELTDGQRCVEQVATALAKDYHIHEAQALQDVVLLFEELASQGVVEVVSVHQSKENDAMQAASTLSVRYVCNPDVVLREEDPDGGLLFNPDTNQVKVVNTTGLFIWKLCDGAHSLDEIAASLKQAFEDAPLDQVRQDVQEFVAGMVETGFLGLAEAA